MDWREYIEQRPDVMLGKPVIKGTRLTVEIILEKLGGGAPPQDILASYPFLRPEHIVFLTLPRRVRELVLVRWPRDGNFLA